MPRLKGKNVANGVALTVFFTNDKSNYEQTIMFTTGAFTYEGSGTYRMSTGDDFDGNGTNDNIMNGEFVMKLEDENTMRWIEQAEDNDNINIGLSLGAYHYEIVLKRAGSSYAPNNNTAPDTPPQVNNTWKITSGSGLISQTISGKNYVSHLTYTPRINDKGLAIDITQNDSSTYYGEHAGLFSVTLTGDNVINSGVKGSGALRVSYSVAENPSSEISNIFTGGKTFSYIDGGTYRMTDSSGEYDITLEDESTIKWKYTAFSVGWYEIVLTKE